MFDFLDHHFSGSVCMPNSLQSGLEAVVLSIRSNLFQEHSGEDEAGENQQMRRPHVVLAQVQHLDVFGMLFDIKVKVSRFREETF